MRIRQWMQLAAIVSAFGAGTAVAADAGISTAQMQNGGPSPGGSVQGYVPPGPAAVGGTQRVDNSNGVPLSEPARSYAQEHGGHLPPTVVIDADGNAWDVVDVAPANAADQDSPQVIFLRPHGESDAAVAPDDDETVSVVPEEDGAIIRFLPDDAELITPVPPSGPGGMQSTPGYMGPGSDKGQ